VRFRKQDGGGDLFSALAHQKLATQRIVGILKLRDLIDWESFRPVLNEITGYTEKDWSKGGRLPFDPVFMFKVLVFSGCASETKSPTVTPSGTSRNSSKKTGGMEVANSSTPFTRF